MLCAVSIYSSWLIEFVILKSDLEHAAYMMSLIIKRSLYS